MTRAACLAGFVLLLGGGWLVADDETSDRGEVLIRSDAGAVVVMIDTVVDASKDGNVDQWFTLQTDSSPAELVHLVHADVHYRRDLLRLISHDARKIYEFAVHGKDVHGPAIAGYEVVRVEGYGLSRSNRRPTVDGARRTCVAGGPGAVASSLKSGSSVCDVACASGSFACSRKTATGVSCKCYR